MKHYTEEDITKYEKYMQDVLDLNSFLQSKIVIYDEACTELNKVFATYKKNLNGKGDNKANLKNTIHDVNNIWTASNAKIMGIIRNKPYDAASSVDHLLEYKKIIGKCKEVEPEEVTLSKALLEYAKKYNEVVKKWSSGGSERKKMMEAYHICIDNQDLLPLYRKFDYLVDAEIGEAKVGLSGIKAVTKVL